MTHGLIMVSKTKIKCTAFLQLFKQIKDRISIVYTAHFKYKVQFTIEKQSNIIIVNLILTSLCQNCANKQQQLLVGLFSIVWLICYTFFDFFIRLKVVSEGLPGGAEAPPVSRGSGGGSPQLAAGVRGGVPPPPHPFLLYFMYL